MRGPFRRRNALSVHDMHYGPNMTPMVDVVMVILIFFMASTAIIGPEWFIRSALPVAKPVPPGQARAAATQQARIQVRMRLVNRQVEINTQVNGKDSRKMSLAEFDAFLLSQLEERPAEKIIVLITPDPNVPYSDVVVAHEAAQRRGISQAGLFDLRESGTENAPAPAIDPRDLEQAGER
jgi:biopolymer transport protein ExbD